MSLTPEQKRLRSSAAAYAQWAAEPDPTGRTAKARGAFLARFEAAVPASVTDPATRARMAEQARRSYFKKLALASSRARSKQGGGDAP